METERIEYATVSRTGSGKDYDLVQALKNRVNARAAAIRLKMKAIEDEKSRKED